MSGFTVARVVQALASVCDGARLKDGRGFSRSHAQTGARLAAMSNNNIPWSNTDYEAAVALLSEYSSQVGRMFSPGDEAKARKIASLVASGKLPAGNDVVEGNAAHPFAVMSPGQRYGYIYLEGSPENFNGIVDAIKSVKNLSHGARRVGAYLSGRITYHISGQQKKGRRWEVTYNSTTQPLFERLATEYGLAVDPALLKKTDSVLDGLLKHERAAYMTKTPGLNGLVWKVVFDLDRKCDEFSEDMKSQLAGKFECSPQNDWNWSVPFNRKTAPIIADLIQKYEFAFCPSIQRLLFAATRNMKP